MERLVKSDIFIIIKIYCFFSERNRQTSDRAEIVKNLFYHRNQHHVSDEIESQIYQKQNIIIHLYVGEQRVLTF